MMKTGSMGLPTATRLLSQPVLIIFMIIRDSRSLSSRSPRYSRWSPVLGDEDLGKGVAAPLGPAQFPGQAHHVDDEFREFREGRKEVDETAHGDVGIEDVPQAEANTHGST
jgi:hypothetical protein